MKDTLQLCIHGTPVKMNCRTCHIEHRLFHAESLIENLQSNIEKCCDKIDKLALVCELQNQVNKISTETNELLSKKIEKLENYVYSENMVAWSEVLKRLNELEKNYQDKSVDQQNIRNSINAIWIRMDEISSGLDKIENTPIKDKKPHSCPLCHGLGSCREYLTIPKCSACEGKGVLWG